MSMQTLIVLLLVWTAAGFLAAIAFGKAIKKSNESDEDEDEHLELRRAKIK